jgi:xylulokinase
MAVLQSLNRETTDVKAKTKQALIGVDIGTQGTKAVLVSEEGTLLASSFRKSALHQPRAGVVEEDPERQVAAVCATIKECVGKAHTAPGSVAALAIAGQMAGVLGVGQDGRNVTPYDSWLDTRCGAYITQMNRVAGDEIIAKTGGPASFNHGPKILWWKHERAKVFRAIAAFVQPGGYAAMRLCGLTARNAFIDKTYLHFSGFADNPRGCWDAGLCRRFSLDAKKLPQIVNPHQVVGELTGSMANRCGLSAGVPVVAGCGDTAASFLACGATRAGICVDVAGTASVFAATTNSFKPDQRFKTLTCGQAATPGLWHPYAYINGGGMNLEWFRKQITGFGSKSRLPKFAALDAAAEAIKPTPDLPMFVPHLGGRVSPGWPDLRGAWVGLTWAHEVPHLWLAMLEGVALEYAIYQQVLRHLHPNLRLVELRATGGGEGSALWNQIKADVLDTPVARVNRSEGAPLGAALLAGFGVGLIKDLDTTARKWIRAGKVVSSNRRLARYYQQRLTGYEAVLKSLNHWSQN